MRTSTPSDDAAKLGEAIRQDAPVFIDAAVAAFRELLTKEYVRMRGYALEIGSPTMILRAEVQCVFEGADRGVMVQTCPQFNPVPLQAVSRLGAE